MFRYLALCALIALACAGCGPDQRQCSGTHPNFVVTVKLGARPLPADTVVRVTYGGSGVEEFRLSEENPRHEVLFCTRKLAVAQLGDAAAEPSGAAGANGAVESDGAAGTDGAADTDGAAGTDGAADTDGAAGTDGAAAGGAQVNEVEELSCQLWTGGFTKLEVHGSGFLVTSYDLKPEQAKCTVTRQLVLDSPDAG